MSYKKQIFKPNVLKKFITQENSCISLMPTVRLLALPPFFLNDMKSGILFLLNSMLKKYDRSLGGIVIGYQNIKVLMDENTGIIPIGTSETEINVSVEFYIFQPRIGSYLEGVINKISNNHIGCLVHQYFNATILKPDDIDYENWVCKNFNVDDKITFKVKDLDFTGLLPYIEGVIDNESLLNMNEYSGHKNYDMDSLVANNLNSSSEKNISKSKNLLKHNKSSDEESDDDFLESEKIKNKNMKIHTLEDNVNKTLDKSDLLNNPKKKKKKKDKEKKKNSILDCNNSEKDKYCNEEVIKPGSSVPNQVNESQLIEKKKKKKLNDINKNDQDSAPVDCMKGNPDSINQIPIEKLVALEDENSNDFIKPYKKKKEKKKKNEEEEPQIFEKLSQCLSSVKPDDSVLYSTLLDPIQSKKMRISCCSPILQVTPVRRNKDKSSSAKDLESTVQITNENETDKKEKKKKQKKREREEKDSQDFYVSKKIKTSHIFPSKEEAEEKMVINDENNSEVQTAVEEVYNQQLDKVRDATNTSDKSSCKEESEKKKKAKKRKKEPTENKVLDVSKNIEIHVNGASDTDKKPESLSNKLERHTVEELNNSVEQNFKENKGTNKEVKKGKEIFNEKTRENFLKVNKISKDQKNYINKEEKKSEVQNMLDELLKEEMERVKNRFKCSETESVEEEKKIKATVSKQEIKREESHLSLYDKLLKEAKSSVELDRNELPNVLSVKELNKNKNIKHSDLSDFSTSSSKKKHSGKKKKHKKDKEEDSNLVPDTYKNGSMYDFLSGEEPTPKKLKINPDKSLFSDSEQSHTSPVKKMKEANRAESKTGNSLVLNMLNELDEEKRKKIHQNESDKESLTSLKKQKKKKSKLGQKSQSTNEKEESLYEKLLKEARSLIDSKEESPPQKK